MLTLKGGEVDTGAGRLVRVLLIVPVSGEAPDLTLCGRAGDALKQLEAAHEHVGQTMPKFELC